MAVAPFDTDPTTAALDEHEELDQFVSEAEAQVAETAPATLTEEARAAYLALYDEAAEAVGRIARRVVGAVEVADDVAQETWLIALQHWPRIYSEFDAEHRRAWLFRVAKTKALDAWRRADRAQQRTLSLSSWPDEPDSIGNTFGSEANNSRESKLSELAEHTAADTRPERVAEAREEWQALLSACRNPRERVMLALRAAAFTHDEIALLLAEAGVGVVSGNAVKLALNRLAGRLGVAGDN